MPCDRDFALIEKIKRKRETVYDFDQWIDIVKASRPSNPFVVVKVNQNIFKDFKGHLGPMFKKSFVSRSKNKLMLSKIKSIEYSKTHPNEVRCFQTSTPGGIGDDFVIEKANVTLSLPIQPMYNNIIAVKPAKKRDIVNIVSKYVPVEFKAFYDSKLNVTESNQPHNVETVDSSNSDDSEAESVNSDVML